MVHKKRAMVIPIMSLLVGLAFVLLSFMGCSEQPSSPELVLGLDAGSQAAALPPTIPGNATITSAQLVMEVVGTNTGTDKVTVHRITSAWAENTVTWNNFGGAFDATVYDEVDVATNGTYTFDITDLVKGWVNGSFPNYGLLIKPTYVNKWHTYRSSEWTVEAERPHVVINYTVGMDNFTLTIYRGSGYDIADTYIWSLGDKADINNGGSEVLYTRLASSSWGGPYEKQTLLQFPLTVEKVGCTRTIGYWKTHSKYGPAPYDPTWEEIGEDTPFFYSGKTYFEAISSTSAGGNAYFTLAKQYVGAVLNVKADAQVPVEVGTALAQAYALFNDPINTPAAIGLLRGSQGVRPEFIALAEILDRYNKGEFGVPHCR